MKKFIVAAAMAVTVAVLLNGQTQADTSAKPMTSAQKRAKMAQNRIKRRRAQSAKLNKHDKAITDIDRTGVLNVPGSNVGSFIGPNMLAFSAERQDSQIVLLATVTNTAKQDLTDMDFTYFRYTGTAWLPLKFQTKTLVSNLTRTFSVTVPVINEAVRFKLEITGHGKKTSQECRLPANLKKFVVHIGTKGKWLLVAELTGHGYEVPGIVENLKSLGFATNVKKGSESKTGEFYFHQVYAYGDDVKRTFDTREDAKQYVLKVWSALHSTTTTTVSVVEQ